MGNNLINEFFDLKEIERQQKIVLDNIKKYVDSISEANKVKINMGGGLSDIQKDVDAVVKSNNMAVNSYGELTRSMQQVFSLKQQLNGSTNDYITNAEKLSKATLNDAKASTESAKARDQAAKSALNEAKATTEAAKQKEIETRYTIALTREKERLEAARDKAAAQLVREQSAYYQLNAEYKAAAKNAQDLGAQYVFLEREIKQMQATSGGNVAPGMTADLNAKRAQLEALGLTVKSAQAKAMELHAALLSIDQAVGRSQRNVGNYNSAVFAMSQILREAPSFAYSFSTGLMGISNNIPILVDEINKLKVANEALKAAGEKTIPIWKTLMGAITSPVGLITIATAAITIFAARSAMAANNMKTAGDVGKKYADTLKQIDESAYGGAASEQAHAAALLSVAKNTSLAMNTRINAVKELQDLYPNYLGNIDKEAILTGKVTDQVESLNKALLARAMMQAGEKKIGAAYEKIFDAEQEIRKLDVEFARQMTEIRKAGDYDPNKSGEATYNYFEQKKDAFRKQIADAKKEAEDFAKDIQKYADAAALLYKGSKDPKGKQGRDDTLKNEQDLTTELYGEYAKRLQLEADVQKAIVDEEKNSYQTRLEAFLKYNELSFEAQAESLSAQYDNIQASLVAIEKIEAKDADKRTAQEKSLLAKKAVILQQLNNLDAQYDLLRQQSFDKASKGVIQLQQDEITKRLIVVKQFTDEISLQEATALNELADKLQKETITYKEYVAQKTILEENFKNTKLTYTKYYLQDEIERLKRQGIDVTKLQEALNSALAGLYNADAANKEKAEKQKAEAIKEIQKLEYDLGSKGIEVLKTAVDGYYDKKLQRLQDEYDAIQRNAQAEIDAINGSMMSDQEKADRTKAINAQLAADEDKIKKKQADVNRQKAIADKVAAEANVVMSTIQAEAAALTYLANPVTAPLYPEIASLIAGIGLAEAAAILLQPIPQYGDGTPAGGHPADGLAIIGERYKPEAIFEPGKDPYVVDKPTLKFLNQGSRVVPQEQWDNQMAAHFGFMTSGLVGNMMVISNGGNDYSQLERVTKDGFDRMAGAIKSIPQTKFIASGGELYRVVDTEKGTITFVNKKFNS